MVDNICGARPRPGQRLLEKKPLCNYFPATGEEGCGRTSCDGNHEDRGRSLCWRDDDPIMTCDACRVKSLGSFALRVVAVGDDGAPLSGWLCEQCKDWRWVGNVLRVCRPRQTAATPLTMAMREQMEAIEAAKSSAALPANVVRSLLGLPSSDPAKATLVLGSGRDVRVPCTIQLWGRKQIRVDITSADLKHSGRGSLGVLLDALREGQALALAAQGKDVWCTARSWDLRKPPSLGTNGTLISITLECEPPTFGHDEAKGAYQVPAPAPVRPALGSPEHGYLVVGGDEGVRIPFVIQRRDDKRIHVGITARALDECTSEGLKSLLMGHLGEAPLPVIIHGERVECFVRSWNVRNVSAPSGALLGTVVDITLERVHPEVAPPEKAPEKEAAVAPKPTPPSIEAIVKAVPDGLDPAGWTAAVLAVHEGYPVGTKWFRPTVAPEHLASHLRGAIAAGTPGKFYVNAYRAYMRAVAPVGKAPTPFTRKPAGLPLDADWD